jgi:hypothetical protein
LGATPVRPLRVRESRLSWHLDACCSPLEDCGADPDPWSLLQGCHVLRESKICACRGLVACCVFFGSCRMAPGSGVILRGRHAPCDNQPIATNVSTLSLLRGIPASRTSLGRFGETRPLTGAGQTLCTTPATRPRLFREARCGRCADANCGSDLLPEVRYRGCVKRQREDHVSLER